MKQLLLVVIVSCLVATFVVIWGANRPIESSELGEDFVQVKGRAITNISRDKNEQLISEFENADYFSLNDNYTERNITDAETVITSITIDGKTKTIEHYRGDFNAPKALTELEDKIDDIVNSAQWIE